MITDILTAGISVTVQAERGRTSRVRGKLASAITVPRIKSRSRAPQPIHPPPASTIEPSNSAGELQYLG